MKVRPYGIRTKDGGEQDEPALRCRRDGHIFKQNWTGILESREALRRVYQRIVRLWRSRRRRPSSCFARYEHRRGRDDGDESTARGGPALDCTGRRLHGRDNSRAIATLGSVGIPRLLDWHIDLAAREIGQDIGLGAGPDPSSSG